MVTPRICLAQSLTPTSMTTFSPNRAPSKHGRFLSNQSQIHAPLHSINVSRREVALLLSLGVLSAASLLRQPLPAFAFNLGISGPKDWLKEQKKKSIKFLLAPIDDSRETLRAAYLLLNKGSDYQKEDLEEVQRLLRYSARDCVPDERNSFVAFQSKTGVEVCTFTLIMKNASSLLEDKDPTKLVAEAKLNDLIRSFSMLTHSANEANLQILSQRQKVAGALIDTLLSLENFEQGVRDCLEV